MAIHPVFEPEAPDNVNECYKKLKSGFALPEIPLFFAYLGAFPEYLQYITTQITALAQNEKFLSLISQTANQFQELTNKRFPPSEDIKNWLERYRYVPSFYNFQKNLSHILENNVKLVFVFIALREAVKGWAVAAKKLPGQTTFQVKSAGSVRGDEFVFNDLIKHLPESSQETINDLTASDKSIATTKNHIEKDLLPEYLMLCRNEFGFVLKTEEFLHVRIAAEKNILSLLEILPEAIFSPINVVLQYTSKYPDFPDLLYLLAEHFPTYAMQRALFSAYMMKDSV